MTLLRVAGAAYLAWLGAVSIYRVWRHPDGGLEMTADAVDRRDTPGTRRLGTSVRQGMTVNLLNPAIATFYLVVVPSFLPSGAPRWYFAALAAIHIAMAFTCHGVWAVGLDQLRRLFHPPMARRILEGATGVALLWLAVRVLAQ